MCNKPWLFSIALDLRKLACCPQAQKDKDDYSFSPNMAVTPYSWKVLRTYVSNIKTVIGRMEKSMNHDMAWVYSVWWEKKLR